MVSDERLALIEQAVNANLNEETGPTKVYPSFPSFSYMRPETNPLPQGGIGAINARVYAVKANQNRLLDVARETYKENVGDIYQLNRTLSQTHDLPLSLVYQDTGFVFSLKKDALEGELPEGFINVTAKKGKYMFSSMDLVSFKTYISTHKRNPIYETLQKKMNARMKDALDETLILSSKYEPTPTLRGLLQTHVFFRIIQELTDEIIHHVGALYKVSEAVSPV